MKTNTKAKSNAITPYEIHVPQHAIDDLHARLAHTRWPADADGLGWDHGTTVPAARDLARAWQTDFDWRAVERRLNDVPQFLTRIDGADVHFFHIRSGAPDAVPLLMLHGWPGQPTEFLPMARALARPGAATRSDAVAHRADPPAFDLVIPTVPGFGAPGPVVGWNSERAAAAFIQLMDRLGYESYAVHGYDLGASIARAMGLQAPERLRLVHVTQVFSPMDERDLDHDDPEQAEALAAAQRYQGLMGYAMVQSTRPQGLALGLHDSPVAMLAWLVERYHEWSAGGPETTGTLTDDDLLTHLSLFWYFGTIGSSMRYYKEGGDEWAAPPKPSSVPLAVCALSGDIGIPVRHVVERTNRVVHWTTLDGVGHFAGWEAPEAVSADIRAAVSAAVGPAGGGSGRATTAG